MAAVRRWTAMDLYVVGIVGMLVGALTVRDGWPLLGLPILTIGAGAAVAGAIELTSAAWLRLRERLDALRGAR